MANDRGLLRKLITGLVSSDPNWTNNQSAVTEARLALSTRSYQGVGLAANYAAGNANIFVGPCTAAEWSDNVVVTEFSVSPLVTASTNANASNYTTFVLQYTDADGTNATNVNVATINTAAIANIAVGGFASANVANAGEIPPGKYVKVLAVNTAGGGFGTAATTVVAARVVVRGK